MKVEVTDSIGVRVIEVDNIGPWLETEAPPLTDPHRGWRVVPPDDIGNVISLHRKVYVAGPMRGYPNFNFPAFDAAATKLRAAGWDVLSPAEHDREEGFDESKGEVDSAFLVKAFTWDVEQILGADAVYFLPGWQASEGATLEHAVAQSTGKKIIYDENVSRQPAFNAAADTTLRRAAAISNQRGGEYLDSWALENMITTFFDATLRALNVSGLSAEDKRLLIVAALIDIKDSRMLGPWKEDTVDDGINYRAAYATWRSAWLVNRAANDTDDAA